jgi:TolB-like protein/Tfp pilus assembly protein PilF
MGAEKQDIGFFGELKRRNVFRVAVAYLVAAWLLLQVADIVLENINAPDWIIQVFMLALLIGLPIALIFAWAFEMTPEGLKREKDVDRSRSITHQTGRKLDRVIIGVLAVAVIVLAIDRFRGSGGAPPAEAETAVAAEEPVDVTPSIAVLPFVNMSSDTEQEYFSDGISEEILNSLAQVKELKVAGRTSSFAFKGQNQDLRQIGDTLGVDHILEGSVRKSGAKVRITAQLVQVDDGFHLWSDTYDRELTDVFEIQDEIANAILTQLRAHLVGVQEVPAAPAAERTAAEVYDMYLLARQRIYERKGPSIEAAAGLLDRAIARDPEYAPAYAQRGIAALLLSEVNYGELPVTEAWSQGKLYIDKALALDPRLAEAWAGLGLYHNNRPGEYPEGIEALNKALAINPNLIDASNWLQISYGEIGDLRRSMEILDSMVGRDPLYPPGFSNAINAYNQFGMQEKSWALLERMRPFIPGDPQLLQAEASIWLSLGRPSRALPLVEQAHDAQPTDFVISNLRSISMLQTAQFDRVVDEGGSPWAQVIALTILDRKEEAGILATRLDAQGQTGILLTYLYLTGRYADLTGLIESRWVDLAAFEAEFPDGGDGYGTMLDVAGAYAQQGKQAPFEDAMGRVRAAHDRAAGQYAEQPNLLRNEARYHALLGDSEQAVAYLERALDQHMIFSAPPHEIWSDLEPLRGEPRYEAVVRRMQERVDAERAALGLAPLST